jgi:hypothetical protein
MDTGAEGSGDVNMGYDSEGILSEEVDDTITGGVSEDDSAAAGVSLTEYHLLIEQWPHF